MMLFLPGAVIGAIGAAPSAESLAGISLGATLADVRSEHPDAQVRRNGAGSRWTWKTPGGGTVTVLADNSERVVKVFFMADRGETDSVDLPCVKTFPVHDSHLNFEATLDQKTCAQLGNNKYQLNNGSILEAFFGGPGDGQLQFVRWYNPREREAAWLSAQIAVSVFECSHDPADAPELRVYDLDRIFAADSIAPHWSFEKPVWKATVCGFLQTRVAKCAARDAGSQELKNPLFYKAFQPHARRAGPRRGGPGFGSFLYAL